MARSASMSRAEAEAAIGPRGALSVTTSNRGAVRKWLVACGVPSINVGTLAMTALEAAYNDKTDANLKDLIGGRPLPRSMQAEPEETGERPGARPGAQPQQHGAAGSSETATSPDASPDASRIAAVIAAVLASLPPAVDLEAVRKAVEDETAKQVAKHSTTIRAFIADELPKAIPTYRVELKTGDETRTLPEKPRHKQFPELLRAVSAGIPTMLIGPAGSGKTMAAEHVAEALDVEFYIQGATTGTHELLGFVDAQGRYQTTPFRAAFEQGGLICIDEIDAGDPGAILVINAALANGHMAFPDNAKPVPRHQDFRVVAAANTFGYGADRQYVGRNQLDAATLDRFVRLHWRYDEKLERMIAGNDSWVDRVQALRKAAEKEKARIVISPRAAIFGARLLASGATRNDAEECLIWAGVDAEMRRRIEAGAKGA